MAGAEAHHALHVLRLKTGDAVELFDGNGRWAAGTITSAGRKEAIVHAERIEGPIDRPLPVIHLAFSVPKGKRLDWLLAKAAELGAATLSPIICDRSVATPAGGKSSSERWRAICASAVRQSRQCYLPEITPARPIAELLGEGPRGVGVIAHGGAGIAPLASLADWATTSEVTILIGPEGGWSDGELSLAQQSGYTPARVGNSILRVETAVVALLAGVLSLSETV